MAAAGEVLAGRYRLDAHIGSGGAATVWRATDEVLGRTVAIKILSAEIEATHARERFIQEAQAAAGLRHPNIVTVFDLGDDEDRPYMVLEYVDGPSLAHVIAEHAPLAPDVVATIGSSVATALGEAHGRGLVHRDVKPGNVLISRAGDVKVADFGIVKALGATERGLTETGVVVGTATYLSPEQLEGDEVGPPTDVYALGLVLHECLTGRPAFGGETSTEVALARLSQVPDRPSETRSDVPQDLDDAIARALNRSAEERYEGGRAFAAALAAASSAEASAVAALAEAPSTQSSTMRLGGDAAGQPDSPRDGTDEIPGPGETDATVAIPPTGGRSVSSSGRTGRRGQGSAQPASRRAASGRDRDSEGLAAAERPPIVAIGLVALLAFAGVLAVMSPWGDRDGDGGETEPIEIVAAEAFDPFGDGEHPDRAPNAHDGDPETSWTTQRYNSPDLGGLKDGVGIWFDLGETTAVDEVGVTFVAGGATVELFAFAEQPTSDTDAWDDPVASVEDASPDLTLEVDGAEGRYWLLWLTSLPSEGGRYRAEISDVRFIED